MTQNQVDLQDRIKALLEEYHDCHQTRDHYDSVRWTIGSIFIASGVLLLGGFVSNRTFTVRAFGHSILHEHGFAPPLHYLVWLRRAR
jgi:hypothetical protein